MSAQLSPTPVFKGWANDGTPLAYGLLTTWAAGTTTPQATYIDSTLTTQNTNPIVLDARGECALWLNPLLTYKFNLTDKSGNQISRYPVDNITNAAQFIDSVNVHYDITPAEISEGVTPINYNYPPGNVLRYGTNTTPGTTDMTLAIQAAINSIATGTTSVEPPISIPTITGGIVTIPAGTYSYSAIRIKSGVTLAGDGYGTWLQQQSGSSNGIYFDNTDTNTFAAAYFCGIRDMQILGVENSSILLRNGINIQAGPGYTAGSTAYLVEALFENVVFRCADKITYFWAPDQPDNTGGFNVRFENCVFRDANVGVFGMLGDPEFLACTFTQLNYGVIANTYSACYEKCTFYRLDRVGLVVLSKGNLVKGCNFESIAYPYIYVSDTSIVTQGGVTYTCLIDHTSSSMTEPGVGGSWTTYWVVYNTANWYDEVIGAMGVLNVASAWATSTQYSASNGAEKNLFLSNRFVDRENRYTGGGRGGNNIPHPELLTSPYAYCDGDLWSTFRDNFTDRSVNLMFQFTNRSASGIADNNDWITATGAGTYMQMLQPFAEVTDPLMAYGFSGPVQISQIAIPAGGIAGQGLQVSTATNFGVFFGSGLPTLFAAKGSLYMRSDGSSSSTRLYVNTDGAGTWTNVVTAA